MSDYARFAAADMEEARGRAERRMEKVMAVQARLRDVVGRARSEDGTIVAECTGGRGLTGLAIDPRAMKLGSHELAETVVRLVQEATDDLRRQTAEMMREELGDLADPRALKDEVHAAQRDFEQKMDHVKEQLALAQARMRSA
ncbi:YbaB/EbfC family nucleoid-associated protein [Actinomadura rupiterrae]|uniref:YbaB/EbfC family nucleoid-associated protein n=1 Tax=Actinomadura rupiterrae TaxID=559627 RepID=UPI0020A559F8|nr:YbaB/EbfC family nucleoid-associated protein [Actinomadura rupiterrae]MCP2337140.1 DNA-binding protein YbaB [Actinomadura rupiterrae]